MTVKDGDLLHADQHGAVVVPAALVQGVAAAARTSPSARRGSSSSRAGAGCTAERLIEVFADLDQIH